MRCLMDLRGETAAYRERFHAFNRDWNSKVAAAMKDVISAAAGIAGFAIESARDLVQYMVKRGQMTPEEAEKHPRRKELQQAIGGQPDVEPGTYSGKMSPGDWVLVCSDGLTNHVPTVDLEKMLRETYGSSEETARRLLNLVNLRGATDNATVVCIRAT